MYNLFYQHNFLALVTKVWQIKYKRIDLVMLVTSISP